MKTKKIICFILLLLFAFNTVEAGIIFTKSSGLTKTQTNGIILQGLDPIYFSPANNLFAYNTNGITVTDVNGATLTGADGATLTGADGVTYTGRNGVTLTGADGVTLTGADGATLTGADGVTLTGADGTTYQANFIKIISPTGVTLTGVDGATLTGADGATLTGADGATLTGADGATLTGADGVTLTGADNIIGIGPNGIIFNLNNPTGATLTGADGVTLTGVDNITIYNGINIVIFDTNDSDNEGISTEGISSIDPELLLLLDKITDDSSINAVISYYQKPNQSDIQQLQQIGITGGTKYRVLPMIAITATKEQLIEVSKLNNIRSIYGNRTLDLNSDPFFNNSGVQRVSGDNDLSNFNSGIPISGKNVTVAVLDTGINSLHNDLNGKVLQNVRLADQQGVPIGFNEPIPVEGVANTDPISGHGTFVAGIIAGNGFASAGKFAGTAPGAKVLGLSAGDLNLVHVLSGFDYVLDKGSNYNVKVINCSFSSNTVYDRNDPVNIATRILTDSGVNVVFSAGNSGPGNGSLNPYAAAPWVVSVGATDANGKLASYSSRGQFGNQKPTLAATGTNVVSLRSVASQTSVLGVTTGTDLQRLSPTELPYYTNASGTSFSAPQVSGAIALMLSANPNLTPAQIKDILQRTATPSPGYYQHEIGAGILNTHAAVLESAFPERKMGNYRSVLERHAVKFSSSTTNTFVETVNPLSTRSNFFTIPANTIQADVQIAWGLSANDLSLKLYDAQNNLLGHSNYLNAPGLTGRFEKLTLNNPTPQTYKSTVALTGNVGTSENFHGVVNLTEVEYVGLNDIETLSLEMQEIVKYSLRSYLVTPRGNKFNPNYAVTREELAEAFVRTGVVPQYVAGHPQFSDVSDITTRNIIESVQSNPNGKLFYDATNGSDFRPYQLATKLATAIALIKAANLENQVTTATMPLNIYDTLSIPSQYRGYVALALNKGLIKADGYNFNPNRGLKRAELSYAMVKLLQINSQ